ncbi:MAG: ferritin-like domain-containing protein [Bacteroidota bacterium]
MKTTSSTTIKSNNTKNTKATNPRGKAATNASRSAATNGTKKAASAKTGSEQESPSLLDKLFVSLLKETYWAEKHLVKALQTMQSQATTESLQDAFEDHMYVTQKHVSRLEKAFGMMEQEPEEKKCIAMEALTTEAEQIVAETEDGTMTRDAALIIAAQKVEHYEIATYGSLVQLARTLGYDNVAGILEKTLWEEEETDLLLTDIAESEVNPLADDEPQEMTAELEMAEL